MALIFLDSFDHYDPSQILGKWDFGAAPNGFVNPGRTNNSLKMANTGIGASSIDFLRKNVSLATDTIICGFGWQCSQLPLSSKEMICSFGDTGRFHCGLTYDSAGRLAMYRCSTGNSGQVGQSVFDVLIAQSSVGIVQPGVWDYVEVEMQCVNSPSNGTVNVYLNGVLVVTDSSHPTSNVSNTINQFNLQGTDIVGAYNLMDDLYIYDTDGSDCNAIAGDTKIVCSYPESDIGPNQFTPSTAGDHYLMVNEVPPDGDTTYLSDATVGDREQFAMTDLDPSVTVVKCVQTVDFSRKDDATTRKYVHQLGDGVATPTDSSDVSPGQTYSFHMKEWMLCPVGNVPWTPTNFNAIAAGLKITL